MDRLSPLDSLFLHLENDVNLMHIGSVAVFEGPAPSYDEVRRMIAGKLPLVPRYRQKVRAIPLELGRPVWIDDPHFRMEYHLRHTALPAPGGTEQLRTLASRIMSQHLDRSRPLWETWVVEGLEDGHWALVSKTHHSLVDGVSGTDLLTVMLDDTPEPSGPVRDDWRPEPEPSDARLAASTLADYLASPAEQARRAAALTDWPRSLAQRGVATAQGLLSAAGLMGPAPSSSLVGPIGPHRRWAWARATLADVKAVRRVLGGSVNDVLLAATTRGFRELLLAHAEPPEQRVIRTLVPVSVRTPAERGVYNNRIAAMVAELPVGIADPAERLDSIRRQLNDLKRSGQAVAAQTLTSLGGFAPPVLLAIGTRAATWAAHRTGRWHIDTITTNVPGPRLPLYALGRRLVEIFPYVPTVSPMRIGVAIFSYDGRLTFGVNADYDAIPDVDVFTRGIEDGVAELVKIAGAVNPPTAGLP